VVLEPYQGNSNLVYSDFTDTSLFGPKDYLDADHLNSEGAKKFTNLLDQKIYELWEKTP
jgi:hypothetical protein